MRRMLVLVCSDIEVCLFNVDADLFLILMYPMCINKTLL